MAKQKRIIPLGQFKHGEISPQAAQSLSPKESPYALRRSKNCFVDLLSGVKSRPGSEYLGDVSINPPTQWYSEGLFYENNDGLAFGTVVEMSSPYMLTSSEHKTNSGLKYLFLFERQSGAWVKIWEATITAAEVLADLHGNKFVYWSGSSWNFKEINSSVVTTHSSIAKSITHSSIAIYGSRCVILNSVPTGSSSVTFYTYGSSWGVDKVYSFDDLGYNSDSVQEIKFAGKDLAIMKRRVDNGSSVYYRVQGCYKNHGNGLWGDFNYSFDPQTSITDFDQYHISLNTNNYFIISSKYQEKQYDRQFNIVFQSTGEGGPGTGTKYEVTYSGAGAVASFDRDIDRLIHYDETTTLKIMTRDAADATGVTWDTENVSGILVDNDKKCYMRISGNYIVYGMSESNPITPSFGSIASIAYKQGSLDYSIVPIADPFNSITNIYLATAGSIDLVYGTSSITQILAPNGAEAIPLTYSQWGKYFLYIDKARTGLFIADVTNDTQFQTIEAFLNNAGNNPDWGSDIPKSMDFHEGRMIFVSEQYFYGASLSHVATNNHPFTFPGIKTTINGDSVPTPANSFAFAPLGGGDIGFSWITSGKHVFSASKKSLWSLSDLSGGVNASSPEMHKLTSLGCSSVKGIQTAGGIYYFQGDEKTVMGLVFNRDSTMAVPINTASRHLFKEHKPVKMVITSGNESNIWILRSDGNLVSYQLNNENMFNAEGSWSWHDLGGIVEDIAEYESADESSLIVSIRRDEPLGESFTVLEKLSTSRRYLDSHTYLASGDSITIERFKNQTVMVKAKEGDFQIPADANGLITFPETLTEAVIGISYDSHFKPRVFPDVHGKEKGRVISIAPIVEDTIGFDYGPDENTLYREQIVEDGSYTGQVRELSINTGAEYMPGFIIKALPGEYMEINAIYTEVE